MDNAAVGHQYYFFSGAINKIYLCLSLVHVLSHRRNRWSRLLFIDLTFTVTTRSMLWLWGRTTNVGAWVRAPVLVRVRECYLDWSLPWGWRGSPCAGEPRQPRWSCRSRGDGCHGQTPPLKHRAGSSRLESSSDAVNRIRNGVAGEAAPDGVAMPLQEGTFVATCIADYALHLCGLHLN